jgi:ankyrin repeat protein
VEDVEELLLRRGVEVNAADHLGNTALHYAASAGHLAAVLVILARPSLRLNATNNVGDTPLHKARRPVLSLSACLLPHPPRTGAHREGIRDWWVGM